MNGMTRAGATLLGAAAAGSLLWLAAQLARDTNGSYWAAYGLVAAGGLLFAVSQWRGRTGYRPGMLALGFLPVLIVAGWVLVAMQPEGTWFRDHVLSWSADIGVADVVRDLGTWLGVLAFGIGFTLGAALQPAPRVVEEAAVEPPVYDTAVDGASADEPVAAERREVGDDVPVHESDRPTTTATTVQR
jgi:hypothetical protein